LLSIPRKSAKELAADLKLVCSADNLAFRLLIPPRHRLAFHHLTRRENRLLAIYRQTLQVKEFACFN
jgi:hypothetical protein